MLFMYRLTLAAMFCILSCMSAFAQSWLTNGLVSYYPFSGNANDARGTNHGTVQGATLTTDRFGDSGAAYSFNGVAWIETPQYRMLDDETNATITAWILMDAGLDPIYGGQIVSAADYRSVLDPVSMRFRLKSAAAVVFQNCTLGNVPQATIGLLGGGIHPLPALTSNTWHHVAVTLDRATNSKGQLTIYIDGIAGYTQIGADDGSSAFSRISYDTSMRLIIGGIEGRTNLPVQQLWMGKIDDLRIYRRGLSAIEVASLYLYESRKQVQLIKAYTLDFDGLQLGVAYQLQASGNLLSWTNWGPAFTATSDRYTNVISFQRVDEWPKVYSRLQAQ